MSRRTRGHAARVPETDLPNSASPRTTVLIALVAALALGAPGFARAGTYYVESGHAGCSDAGPGRSDSPYCTINAALAAHRGPGVRIKVRAGTYYECVVVPESGDRGNPFLLEGSSGTLIDATNQPAGIVVEGHDWVTIKGFKVTGSATGMAHALEGIVVKHARNVAVLDCNVSEPSHWGINVTDAESVLVASNTVRACPAHGIQLRGVTYSVIEDNVSIDNTNGINLVGYDTETKGNVLRRNRFTGSTGSGVYLQKGSRENLLIQNVYTGNEHGIQHNGSTDCRHIGEVVYGNFDDAITLKDGSTGNQFYNCIVVNNGLGRTAFDLHVEDDSMAGLVSEDNIIWNRNDQEPIRYGRDVHATVSSFSAATGLDTRSLQVDPMFLDPGRGDFRLVQGSRAIDSGNAALDGWPETDAHGVPRFDDPATPNTGRGVVDFADRGAFEFAPAGLPPIAVLRAHPSGKDPGHTITADASESHDPEGRIAWYVFDFGDGVKLAPQRGATATHAYDAGTWIATVTVVDSSGWTASDAETVTVATAPPPPVRFQTALLAPLPNPMRGAGRFPFTLANVARVRFTIVDVQGRTLTELSHRFHPAGRHEVVWDGRGSNGPARPGLYFLRMEGAGPTISRRFVLER